MLTEDVRCDPHEGRFPGAAAAVEPEQGRQQQRQLEADAAGWNRADVVASLEGRAVEGAGHARLHVAERDAGLGGAVMGRSTSR